MSSDKQDTNVISINKNREVPRSHDNGNSADEVCPICFGTGTRLEAGKGAVICVCRRTNSSSRALEAARIPPRFRHCSFHNYYPQPGNDSQYFAHSLASRLVDDYPAVDVGLLLMGPVGVGKTHLAVAILKELIEKKGVSCLFYESGSLLKAIQDSYNPISQTSETRVLAPVYQAEVLVLDELGASVATNWVRDTLYQIINTRYNNKKLTIFTTNYLDDTRPEKLEESESTSRSFSKKRDSERIRALTTLEDQIGTPLRSRLYEMCRKVMIEGEDFRKRLEKRRSDSAKA
ncbi:MAG TPA: ATP-binding protein [Pyrinomonadaceae bacterium]|nr:ATP-binding protein [Pyrinomonadaceae bacterium]